MPKTNSFLLFCVNSRFTQFKLLEHFCFSVIKASLLKVLSGAGTKANVTWPLWSATSSSLSVCLAPPLGETVLFSKGGVPRIGMQELCSDMDVCGIWRLCQADSASLKKPPSSRCCCNCCRMPHAACDLLLLCCSSARCGRGRAPKKEFNGSRPSHVLPQDLIILFLTSLCPPFLLVSRW